MDGEEQDGDGGEKGSQRRRKKNRRMKSKSKRSKWIDGCRRRWWLRLNRNA